MKQNDIEECEERVTSIINIINRLDFNTPQENLRILTEFLNKNYPNTQDKEWE